MTSYKIDAAPEGAHEGDIPYYAKWSDGSEYEAAWHKGREGRAFYRRYHGPRFNRPLGDWRLETIGHT